MPMPDNEMKAGIFPGEAIIVEGGKISSILPGFSGRKIPFMARSDIYF
jgi:hypothetical protein